jgi:hypothetical protein
MRLYTGLISITGGPYSLNVGGTRRETLAYDSYLDMLALFHHNGAIYDARGDIVFQGIIKISFDGDYWLGWFNTFSVSETAEQPYQFTMSADFTIAQEFMGLRTVVQQSVNRASSGGTDPLFQDLAQKQADDQLRADEALDPESLDARAREELAPILDATQASLGWVVAEDPDTTKSSW